MQIKQLVFVLSILLIDMNLFAQAQSAGQAELLYKLELLQQEMQTLRGQLEEQAHELEKLKRDQRDRYLDVDRRLSQLSASPIPPPLTAPIANAPAVITQNNNESVASPPNNKVLNPSQNEQIAYQSAFSFVQQKKYKEALNALQQFTQRYPSGALTANAYYWLGEVYLALSDLDSAKQSFSYVVNNYERHRKLPDALFKLGVVHHKQGDNRRAKELMLRVTNQYVGTTAASLATNYLNKL